jgi:biopolymer transport protein ExbD
MDDKNKKDKAPANEPAKAALSEAELEVLENLKKIQGKRKEKAKSRRGGGEMGVSITSLMDIMTIMLVFLLMNYASNPTNITPSADLQLVQSLETTEQHDHLTTLAITQTHILVDDKPVVQVKDGKVSPTAKRDGEDGYFITPLFDALQASADYQKKLASYNKSIKFQGRLMVIGDEIVPFRLLSEVLYTAGQAEYGEFEFAVIRL